MSATQPNPVTNLTATAASVSEIDLLWANNNPGFEAGALIERALPGQSTNFQALATVAAGVSSYADTRVLPGGTYLYRITALPFSSRAFVPALSVTASATTPGIPPHLRLKYPPHYVNGDFAQVATGVTDGTW